MEIVFICSTSGQCVQKWKKRHSKNVFFYDKNPRHMPEKKLPIVTIFLQDGIV